jgi:hypothetical protein
MSAGATFRQPDLPIEVASGDILFAQVGCKAAEAHELREGYGWQLVAAQQTVGGVWQASLWWRVADGGQTPPVFGWTSSVGCFAQIVAINRGRAAIGNPFGAIGVATGTGTPHSVSALTAQADNAGLFYFGCADANTGYAVPAGCAESLDNGGAAGVTRNVCGYKTTQYTIGQSTGGITMAAPNGNYALWYVEMTQGSGTGPSSKRRRHLGEIM